MSQLISTLFSNDLLLACATCMGDPGSVTNMAAGYAIAFMLVMLAFVLGGLIKFMHYLKKREGGAPNPPIH